MIATDALDHPSGPSTRAPDGRKCPKLLVWASRWLVLALPLCYRADMAAVTTYTVDTSLETIDEDLTYTISVLKHLSFASALVAEFEAMLARCDAVTSKQRTLRRAIIVAQGGITSADATLDAIVDEVDVAVSRLAEKTAGHPTRQLFFRGMRASDLRRPVLGFELETLRAWPTALESTDYDSLKAMAPTVAAALKTADDAVAAQTTAQDQNRIFRLAGERKVFIDDANALRARAYGVLSTYAHDHPKERVPGEVASIAFRKSRRASKATIESLDLELVVMREQVASLESQRAELTTQQAATAQRAAEDASRRGAEEVAAAQRAVDEATKKLAEVKAKASN